MWLVRGQSNIQWGFPGDIPVPGDYNGDLRTEIAVFRPSDGGWYLQQRRRRDWMGTERRHPRAR
jgi:hypothetical protein